MPDTLNRREGAVLRCGTSDPMWARFPELAGRHCIREAGHDGAHVAQRDDETHQETAVRCLGVSAHA